MGTQTYDVGGGTVSQLNGVDREVNQGIRSRPLFGRSP
jgi:hypothetical protein